MPTGGIEFSERRWKRRETMSATDIHIHAINLDVQEQALGDAWNLLSAEEKRRAKRFISPQLCNRWVVARRRAAYRCLHAQ